MKKGVSIDKSVKIVYDFGILLFYEQKNYFYRKTMASYQISVGQMTSTAEIAQNVKQAKRFIEEAKKRGSEMISLPEMFHYLGESKEAKFASAQSIDGDLVQQFQEYASQYSIAIALGSFYEKIPDKPDKLYNTAVFIETNGEVTGVYRKLHLCDIQTTTMQHLESKDILAGDAVAVFDSSVGRIGSTICYDIRFPALYQTLRDQGAEIILTPAAFFVETGKDHWVTLLQARAIETQSYIVSSAQYGWHYNTRCSYGNSVIIDPWGKVIACAAERECLITAEIDLDYLKLIRQRICVTEHRRNDVYSK